MKYVHYALFKDLTEAQRALRDIEATGALGNDVVVAMHENKIVDYDMRSSESDGKRGFVLGLLSGAGAGVLLGLLLSAAGVLPFEMLHAAFIGLALGCIIGALGAGLFGAGLPALPLHQLRDRWREGNVLVTAEAEGAMTMARVDRIFRRHHALVAA